MVQKLGLTLGLAKQALTNACAVQELLESLGVKLLLFKSLCRSRSNLWLRFEIPRVAPESRGPVWYLGHFFV